MPSTPSGVVRTEGLDPGVVLHELVAVAVDVEAEADDTHDDQREQREAERDLLRQVRPGGLVTLTRRLRQQGHDDCADDRQQQ